MKREMKKVYLMFIASVVVIFLISVFFRGAFTIEEMSFYLTVTGLIYGLMAAFTISNVWEKYSEIRSSIAEEISSLQSAYELFRHFKDKTLLIKFGKVVSDYCNYIHGTFWKDYNIKNHLSNPKFLALFDFIGEVKPKHKQYDSALWEKFLEEIQDVSTARTKQLTLASHGVSRLRWGLLVFLSVSVIGGMLLTVSQSGVNVAAFINTVMGAAILLILVVIFELDMLEFNIEVISNVPYRRVAEHVSK